ncbi:nuclease [Salmonella enterica subsp. enterica serovar Java]|uniref:ParB/Srx family N-terminal domain-containing protein n=1 Tax=Salmonella enterica TaxID=28901 RepID=UPI0006D4B59A|nr:ParB/Srx family N-terminal domain-containing protein [Salmonella enterica]EBQ5984344.1 nuclease [Salmonella enterica subsp. houtenae serovar Houten]EBS3902551.1 nuclease [Salmonella enterica subsp. enterica serovar Heidelberg]EBS5734990.1 nuclease [Salmonella enterica subsp. enterica serovar Stanley]EBV4659175.1 nuclease [Salmonella enterica subsp. enterica serovar Typhimurium]EBW4448009.1 nuclease [Salmonella enterica subsp. enterica serovar Arechavaleta]ECA2815305.1 nuclease [Salmonella 
MTKQLKVVSLPLSALIGYEKNARTHSDEQVEQIVRSIQEYGWTNPILIDEHNVVIAGHGRIAAATALELVDVPCIVLSGLTPNQKKAYRLADNRIPLNAGWDETLLSEELAELSADGFEMDNIGFTQDELDKLLAVALPGDADGMDIPFGKEEAKSGVSVQYLSFGGHKIPSTDEEAERFDSAVARYVEDNGSYIGFVAALLAGEVC